MKSQGDWKKLKVCIKHFEATRLYFEPYKDVDELAASVFYNEGDRLEKVGTYASNKLAAKRFASALLWKEEYKDAEQRIERSQKSSAVKLLVINSKGKIEKSDSPLCEGIQESLENDDRFVFTQTDTQIEKYKGKLRTDIYVFTVLDDYKLADPFSVNKFNDHTGVANAVVMHSDKISIDSYTEAVEVNETKKIVRYIEIRKDGKFKFVTKSKKIQGAAELKKLRKKKKYKAWPIKTYKTVRAILSKNVVESKMVIKGMYDVFDNRKISEKLETVEYFTRVDSKIEWYSFEGDKRALLPKELELCNLKKVGNTTISIETEEVVAKLLTKEELYRAALKQNPPFQVVTRKIASVLEENFQ